MSVIVLDPGHGGDQPSGKSTPYGHRPPQGPAEKDVTLAAARELALRLGGGVRLTRQGDDNPSIGARQAQAFGARAFVSLHTSPLDGAPAEVWHHPAASGASRALAQSLGETLGAPVRSDAAMAVLSPTAGAAPAVLLELDHARAADPHQRSALLAAVAYGLRRYLGDDEAADPDAFGQEAPIDDEAAGPQGMAVSRALTISPEYPGARRFTAARAGHFTTPATARSISRIVIHITDGRTTNGAVSWFQSADNTAHTASHYIVGQDGEVVQMVRHADIAHHAKGANRDSIGIEHVAESPATARKRGRGALAPSDAQYSASAALVSWLCDTYNIPTTRAHILGHSEVGSTNHADCPQSVWDWDHFMGLVRDRVSRARGRRAGAPFATAQELLQVDLDGASSLGEIFRRVSAHVGRQGRWRAGVSDTTIFPFSAICQLQLNDASGGGPAFGTGFYIGRETILTCGHNFYDRNPDGSLWETTKVLVQPGCSPIASTFATKEFRVTGGNLVHPDWKAAIDASTQSLGKDLAVLRVPGLPAPNGRWLRLPNMSPAVTSFFVAGFGKEGNTTAEMLQEPMRAEGGPVVSWNLDLIEYAMNTVGGHSGSPVFIEEAGGMVIGVHTGPAVTNRRRANRGVYLDPAKVDWILGRADASAAP